MVQVLVGYQLVRCQVSRPFLSVYPSIITHPFFSLLSITLLRGQQRFMQAFLKVRDGRTGLWVTGSSCVVDGVFVGQCEQECSCALRLSAGPGRTLDLLCVSLTAVLLFFFFCRFEAFRGLSRDSRNSSEFRNFWELSTRRDEIF